MTEHMATFLNEKLAMLDTFEAGSANQAIACAYLRGVQDTLSLLDETKDAAAFIGSRISQAAMSQFLTNTKG